MSYMKQKWWDDHPCSECDEAPSLLEGNLCEGCAEGDKTRMSQDVIA